MGVKYIVHRSKIYTVHNLEAIPTDDILHDLVVVG